MASYDDFPENAGMLKTPRFDELVEWVRIGRAEVHMTDRDAIISWGLGSFHNYFMTPTEHRKLMRQVRLVEGRISAERRMRRTRVGETRYAAYGHQTHEDKHDFHGIGNPQNWA